MIHELNIGDEVRIMRGGTVGAHGVIVGFSEKRLPLCREEHLYVRVRKPWGEVEELLAKNVRPAL